jgi:hypothetical protein
MVNEFKFFWGIPKKGRVLRVDWRPELMDDGVDVEEGLTRIMSEQIARSIDDDIINELRRRINGGYNQRA